MPSSRARDPIYGEERRAFPVDVPEGRAQAISSKLAWARHRPEPVLRLGEALLARRLGGSTVEVRVRGFDLPATPALTTPSGFPGIPRPGATAAAWRLRRAHPRLRPGRASPGITLFGGTQDPPSFSKDGDEVRIDWTSYDAEVGPFLDGKALPGGTRWTAVEPAGTRQAHPGQRRSYRRQWQEHFRQRGWLDRLFRYVEDEPSRTPSRAWPSGRGRCGRTPPRCVAW